MGYDVISLFFNKTAYFHNLSKNCKYFIRIFQCFMRFTRPTLHCELVSNIIYSTAILALEA